ncbi:unnamed protein product [Caenorhabditis angaria]|uniref:Pepsin inhibitor-3-like repeated domain-containing protein n=1 Tax=Caenorhabditis angaria TaxID=860376 RepID=A0A9P1IB81_9PELO|nr:unnamed protein product [Caenorhabditis angaria]
MMKLFVFASLVAIAFCAPREKRQLSVSTIAVTGAGGSQGCVVTGNVLYANGIKLRDLTAAEQTELTTYQTEVEQYKNQLREILNQRRENLKSRLMSRGQPQQQQQQQNNQVDNEENLPKAPEKPSFCTAEETTQYYFDGCMVQNNKVYVGGQFARDLSSDEQSQLKTFDTEQTAYQKAVQAQMQTQVRGLFGGSDFLSALFGEDSGVNQQQAVATTPASTGTSTLPPKPTVPQFCTAIY